MTERVRPPEVPIDLFEKLDGHSRANKALSSVPLDLDGEPIVDLLGYFAKKTYSTEAPVIIYAALLDYATCVGDEKLAEGLRKKREQYKTIIPSVITDFQFDKPTGELSILPTTVKAKEGIQDLLSWFIKKRDKKDVYAPYFTSEDPNSQLNITSHVDSLVAKVTQDLDHPQDPKALLNIFAIPQIGECVAASAPMKALPLALPLSVTPGDFDTAFCDIALNSAMARGEKYQILAEYGHYVFIRGGFSNGWVPKETMILVQIRENYLRNTRYVGGEILFINTNGEKDTLIPGDLVYSTQEGYGVPYNHAGRRGTRTIPDSIETKERFHSPDAIYEFLEKGEVPYEGGKYDCSEVTRRVLELIGLPPMGKYSGDIFANLESLFGNTHTFTPESLKTTKDGLYIIQLLAREKSIHLFFDWVRGGNHSVLSQAFQIVGDSGKIETPVGIHYCTEKGLLKQLENGREIKAVKIGSRKERSARAA